MRTLPFHQVDVFSERPLAGNPLAVFTQADGLSAGEMQAIAREMNLSETTFIMAAEGEGDARVRIFTPTVELPFAGHPSVGTACELVRQGVVPAVEPVTKVVLELAVGPTLVEVIVGDGRPLAATVHQGRPMVGPWLPRDVVARTLGLSPEDLHPDLDPRIIGTGLSYSIVPLSSTAALSRVLLDLQLLPGFEQQYAELYPCAFSDDPGVWVEARGLFPLCGISEDPATGSAAGPLAAYMALAGRLSAGEERVVLQGRHIGRPSELVVSVQARSGVTGVGEPWADGAELDDVLVGGRVHLVARGELYLPD